MRHATHVLMLLAVSTMIGCGGETLDGTTAVTGTVTHNGQPVEGATVIFNPTEDGRAASGTTDASGKFTLTTLTASDGVMPGTYKVTVFKTEVEGGMTVEESQAYLQEHNEPPPAPTTRDLLPERYKDAAESGLTATVTEGGENDFTFDLTD